MHNIRIIFAVILVVIAFGCLMVGIAQFSEYVPESITKFLVAVLLCLLAVALILK